MVDFQSRDTRRGVGGDDDADEDDSSESEAEEQEETEAQSDAGDGEPATADTTTGADDVAGVGDSSGGEEADSEESAGQSTESEQSDPVAEGDSGPTGDADAGADPLAEGRSDPDPVNDGEAETDPLAEGRSDPAPVDDGEAETDPLAEGQSDPVDDGEAETLAEERPDSSATPDRTGGSPGVKTTADPGDAGEPTTPTDVIPAAVAVVTVGTATDSGDPTGDALVSSLERVGHSVPTRERLRGEYDTVQGTVDTLVGRGDVDVVVVAGGTGVRAGEVTIEAVHPLLAKALPGFGEVFRSILAEEIGTGVVGVRATAGIADDVPVFCIPGEAEIATLAVDEVIAEEGGRLADHLS